MGEACLPNGPQILRREACVLSALAGSAPVPRLEHMVESDDWVALVLEDVQGSSPRQPWDHAELGQVLSAMAALAATLTPAPIAAPAAAEHWQDEFTGWRQLAASDRAAVTELSPWAGDHVDELARWETSWTDAAHGQTLLHGDLRADNMLLTADGVVFVDWPWACVGAPWVDLVLMLPSVAMQGGGDPEAIVTSHPLTQTIEPDAITSVLAAVTGFFVFGSLQPPPPGIPLLRGFQRAQGLVALNWLRQRLGQADLARN
ncbi:phosphotransferase family enzyme [Solirubrobacter pauli]|uniref:Phosphotransferase family enzyme n=2 Tax=Solirubrobacter pauli TaxID=166793 RepID=A0A660L908_9ACTN|nr:phosphotransferase family enzyme [Solirubrobacter pauli]